MYYVELRVYNTTKQKLQQSMYSTAMNAQYYCCYSQRHVTNELEILQFHCQKTRKTPAMRAEDGENDEAI